MADNAEDKTAQTSADNALLALQARVTELENVVHALVPGVGDKHNVLVAWLEKIGARIKAAL